MMDKATLLRRLSFLDEEVGYDYIMDEYHTNEFSEYVANFGGDVIKYRVYGDKKDEMRVYCK